MEKYLINSMGRKIIVYTASGICAKQELDLLFLLLSFRKIINKAKMALSFNMEPCVLLSLRFRLVEDRTNSSDQSNCMG